MTAPQASVVDLVRVLQFKLADERRRVADLADDLKAAEGALQRIRDLIGEEAGMGFRPFGSTLRMFSEADIRAALDGDGDEGDDR